MCVNKIIHSLPLGVLNSFQLRAPIKSGSSCVVCAGPVSSACSNEASGMFYNGTVSAPDRYTVIVVGSDQQQKNSHHYRTTDILSCYAQNPLHQFPRSKSVTSWRGQKSVVSVVSCRFPNSITTTCCQLVADLLALLPQLQGSYGETCVMDFGLY